jgi:hypothetical protein
MPVVKRVDVFSVAKIGALFGLVMGIVWGIFYGMLAAARIGRVAPFFGAFSGIALLILMPICGILIGCIMGAIHAFLYNVFAGWIGGISVEFKE